MTYLQIIEARRSHWPCGHVWSSWRAVLVAKGAIGDLGACPVLFDVANLRAVAAVTRHAKADV